MTFVDYKLPLTRLIMSELKDSFVINHILFVSKCKMEQQPSIQQLYREMENIYYMESYKAYVKR